MTPIPTGSEGRSKGLLRQSNVVTFLLMNMCTPIDIEGVMFVCPKYDIDIYNEQL